MLILAIETTGQLASCALYDGTQITQFVNKTDYSHLEEITPMVKQLLESRGIKPEELSALAVSQGPGSFTGVRIGVATAKGLALIWKKPLIEVPTLEAFSFSDELKEGEIAAPLFDARRSQVYASASAAGVEGSAYYIDQFLDKLQAGLKDGQTAVFFGDGIKAYKEKLDAFPKAFRYASEEKRYQLAENTAKLGAELFKKGVMKDAYTAMPDYFRAPEAERKLKEKQANGR